MENYRWNPYKDRSASDEYRNSDWNYDPRDQNYYLGRINEPGSTDRDERYYTDGYSDRYYRNNELGYRNNIPETYQDNRNTYQNNDFYGQRAKNYSWGPHRGKGPKNYSRSIERIREDASDRLTEDTLVDASKIEIWVKDNELVLSGTVDTRFEKRRAEHLVENVSGVKHVQNNLRVAGDGGNG